MIYNEPYGENSFITKINIFDTELIQLKRASNEYHVMSWIIPYIENIMKRPLTEETKAKYYHLYAKKKEQYTAERIKLKRAIIQDLNLDSIQWDYDFRKKVLSIVTDKKIFIDDSYLNRPPSLLIDTYQSYIASLYEIDWRGDIHDDIHHVVPIRTCTIQLTEACNLRCSYCYQINKKENSVISFDTAKKFIDMILNADSNTPYLKANTMHGAIWDFVGGESFVEVDLMDRICEYIIDSMLQMEHPWLFTTRLSTSSNGTLHMTDKVQKFLDKWGPMFSTAITVDGCKELHDMCRVFPDGSGSYDLAIAAVRDIDRRGYNIGSKVTISPDNLPMLSKAIINLVEEGYTDLHANPVFEEGWTIDHAKEYYRQLKKIADYFLENDLYRKTEFVMFKEHGIGHLADDNQANWCGGNGAMIAVNPSGKIYPCLRYMESSVGNDAPPYIIGDVDSGLLYTDHQKKLSRGLEIITRSSQSTKECMDCPVNEGCAWCTAYNYQKFGTPNKRATYICWMHKAEVLANVYYWNQVRIKCPLPDLYPFINRLPDEDSLQIISEDELKLLKTLQQSAIEFTEEMLGLSIAEYPESVLGFNK